MKTIPALLLLSLSMLSPVAWAECAQWLDHDIKKLHSKKQIDLCSATDSKTVLIVNTASNCGFTPQFKELEALHQKYKEQGLVLIGFPSNSFYQEAKSEEQTAEVCYKNFGVSFLMTEPVAVKGPNSHSIFKTIAEQVGAPNWNFNKVLISSDGDVIERFSSSTSPSGEALMNAIETQLKKSS
jgi:glutathione peroxidase